MSLKDILGFDPAVQCHPLSLAFCLVLVFFSTSYFVSLHSRVAILSSLASFSLSLFLPLSFPLSLPPSLLATVSVSVSRTEEGSAPGNSFAETWHRVQQNTNDIFTWRQGRNRARWIYSGKVYRALRQRGERGGGGEETRNVFFEKNSLIHSRSRAEVRPQFLPSSASDEF